MNIINYKTYTYTGTTRYKYDLLYIHGRHNGKFEDTKVVSESVYRRRTDNTMATENRQKNQQQSTKHYT